MRYSKYLIALGVQPKGKATGSDPVIGGSTPSTPAIKKLFDFIKKFCYNIYVNKEKLIYV